MEDVLALMKEYVDHHVADMADESFTANMVVAVRELVDVDDDMMFHALCLFPHGRTTYFTKDQEGVQLDALYAQVQFEQRSPEWFAQRKTLITASSAYKVLGSAAKQREWLRDKTEGHVQYGINTASPMHWGVKYEPVASAYYEYVNQVTLGEFGCLVHPTHTFLGASPDGIVTSSKWHGRMLEIKCPFSRELTGIPKREYWIQCQLQMEVCQLDACDFLEVRFEEYEHGDKFTCDGTFLRSAKGEYKGMVLQEFDGSQVSYVYPPFQMPEEEYVKWEEAHVTDHWVTTLYWKIVDVSCVHIRRQPGWVASVLPQLAAMHQTLGL